MRATFRIGGCRIQSLAATPTEVSTPHILSSYHGSGASLRFCRCAQNNTQSVFSGDAVVKTAGDNYDLALRSLGAVVWYLTYSFLDESVLSLKAFQEYVPLDSAPKANPLEYENSRMVRHFLTSDSVCNPSKRLPCLGHSFIPVMI